MCGILKFTIYNWITCYTLGHRMWVRAREKRGQCTLASGSILKICLCILFVQWFNKIECKYNLVFIRFDVLGCRRRYHFEDLCLCRRRLDFGMFLFVSLFTNFVVDFILFVKFICTSQQIDQSSRNVKRKKIKVLFYI